MVFSTFSDIERKSSGNCQSNISRIVKTAICLWTFSRKRKFYEKSTISFHHHFWDIAWKNSGLSMCPQETFKEKLWILWKTYKFFSSVHFHYKAKIFHRVSQLCIARVNGSILRENYYFFEKKHPLLSLSDIVRKISGVASDFFRQGCRSCFLRVYENNMKKNDF